jgi:hypothetical protein
MAAKATKPSTVKTAQPSQSTEQTAPESQAPKAGSVIDITKLTPAQLKEIQKQLKEKSKEVRSRKDERFAIIDTMLKEKNEDTGEFRWTTSDILETLVKNDLVNTSMPDYRQVELKKIQARKQFLEKRRDEKGELIDPPDTYGYKPSEFRGFGLNTDKVVDYCIENADKFTPEQREKVIQALS